MTSLLVNRRDLSFLLYELLDSEELTERERFAGHSRETFDTALDTAHDIATEWFLPHAAAADEHEPTLGADGVRCLPAMRAALATYVETGFVAATQDEALGGMQLPFSVFQACFGIVTAANTAAAGYLLLTQGAANLVRRFGSPAQIETFCRPMLEGRFFGTMALTEPQAGSALADVRTTAEPAADGSYRLTGGKIFISGGDHDLAENIIHLTLARVRGAPAGVAGLSLFIVPKYLINADGTLGRRNDVATAGLIHKMGYRGTTSTVLSFGERGDCVGYLLGRPNHGLACMFHMMNEARTTVGLGAAMLAYTGYLHALDYARTRTQGRPAHAKHPASPPVPIVEHADVKRMLLVQKTFAEGSLALCLYAARLVDDAFTAEEESARGDARLLLEVLTPVVKAWVSDVCLEASYQSMQTLGGYGYTRDYPVERFYRDNRLNPIHEGTNGIQAIDLLGRKVTLEDGAAFTLLLDRMRTTIEAARSVERMSGYAEALDQAVRRLSATTHTLRQRADESDRFLANASLYLWLLGHVVGGWIWLEQARVAAHALATAAPSEQAFYQGKLLACRYFMTWELPRIEHWAALLERFDDTCLSARPECL